MNNPYRIGDKVWVKEFGKWWEGTVTFVGPKFCLVLQSGYTSKQVKIKHLLPREYSR